MPERQKGMTRPIARRKRIRQTNSDSDKRQYADIPPDNPEQYERFREFVTDQDADSDADKFNDAFRRMVPPKQPKGS